ncbi:DNA ligase [Streptomyces sp. ME02-6979.5a]|uniref:ATP-dependent DNA ligase n=1 Tax=Streptomyces sp. ME02-6979.5a TaxID=462925 RepID=UPI0029B0EB9B|nr:DNA ligase [Streptomyces sp. ME02-6979.5a]MDX3343753.1 DNA ligase [Streptomyces sp. ME02-6979.5a]
MEFPVRPALARAVPTLPTGPGWWFECKVDGHRMVLRRTDDGVICYSRTGRTVTSHWMDLAVPAMQLPPGTVLDGEAVIWHDGRIDFGAAQARAASSLDRARALAARLPASYMAFDVLAHPDHGGDALAARPYTERRTVLVDVLAGIGPPLQPVPATADRDTALEWYETLQPQGVEGIVAKPSGSPYPFGSRTVWRKIRHADTTDANVVGSVGPRRRPRRLALLPAGEGRPRLSAPLDPVLAARLGALLDGAIETGEQRTETGETYTGLVTGLVVEVLAGTGRHGTLSVVRAR